jgi:hypothetical protein
MSARKDADNEMSEILKDVNEFVNKNVRLYGGMASQWGQIRSIASKMDGNSLKKAIIEYIGHGVSSNEWGKQKREDKLKEFMEGYSDDRKLRRAIVNLSSEMAKKVKEK